MKYSIDCYEIDRYEVRIYENGIMHLQVCFDTEEAAVEYAAEFIQDHPDFKLKLYRIEHAVLSQK